MNAAIEARSPAARQPSDGPRAKTSTATGNSALTLLLPVDGSSGANAAARFAASYVNELGNARVIVVHVDARGHAVDAAPDPTPASRAILEAAGVSCASRTASGDPAKAILELSGEADEIIMGRTGLGAAKELLVGSVTQRVIRSARCPVTVVAPDFRKSLADEPSQHPHRILLAVDGSANAMRAVEYVCRRSQAYPAVEVELMNVVGPIPPGYLWEFITPERLEHYYQQEGNRALFQPRAALVAAGVRFNQHIVAGYTIERLVDAATTCKCARIVMGSGGLGAFAGMALGSVAYRAMHVSPVPVTIVN